MASNNLSQQQLTSLINQNQSLAQQLSKTKEQNKKLSQKYEKALQQLALIVRANQNLKKQYDNLESHMNNLIEEKTLANEEKIKHYLRQDLDQLNKTIEKLTECKDKLELDKNKVDLENSTLKMKLNSLTQEKTKLINEKEQYQIKYQALQNQLEELDPQTRDNNQRAIAVKELKDRANLVDQLQLMVHKLQDQKQQIHKQYQEQLSKIQKLWNEWRDFQKQLKINSKDYIRLSGISQQGKGNETQKNAQENSQAGQTHKKRKRRASIIFEQGMNLIKGKAKQNSLLQRQNKTHKQQDNISLKQSKNQQLRQQTQQIQTLKNQLQQIQTQNKRLKSMAETAQLNQTQFNELKKINQKLTEEKLVAQQRLSQLRIKQVMQQASQQKNSESQGEETYRGHSARLSQLSQAYNNKSAEDDLISILRDLHQQLSPLRQELMTLKKQQLQQSQTTSTERATFQVKLIRLQKQLSFYKQHNQMLKKQLAQVKSQKTLIGDLQKKLDEIEEQKSLLEGKMIVLETLNVADRTRVDGETYAVLKEFEKRMELLVQGDSLFIKQFQGNQLQHLIAMKAYILELDERLKKMGVENDKLNKKYQYSKEKINQLNLQIKELSGNQSGRVLMYKQKIQAYDKLVNKLTVELEKNISRNTTNSLNNLNHLSDLQSHHSHLRHANNIPNFPTAPISRFTSQAHQIQKNSAKPSPSNEYNQVINLYEQKMINMGEEIVRIRGDKQSMQGQVKELRDRLSDKIKQVNDRIKQLNDKERQLVMVKTMNINFVNENKLLQKEITQFKILYGNQIKKYHQKEGQDNKMIHKENELGQNDKAQPQDSIMLQNSESVELKYEKQIATLKSTIQQLTTKVNHMQRHRQNSPMSKKHIKQQEQYEVGQKNLKSHQKSNHLNMNQELEQEKIRRIRQEFEEENIASVELAIANHNQIVEQLNMEYQQQIKAKIMIIEQKQQLINQLQGQIRQFHSQLQQLTIKNEAMFKQQQQNHQYRQQLDQTYQQAQKLESELEELQNHQQLRQSQQMNQDPMNPQEIQSLQAKLSVSNQHILQLQQQKQSLSQHLKSKDRQLRQLQQVVLKNNLQLTQLRNQRKFSHYSQIQTQNLITPQSHLLIQQNSRLNNIIFELNVKISGLQSIKYNLKLQNQILKSDCQFMQDRLHSVENDIKMKNSNIFHLENDLRNYSSTFDSTIMAKDSLIRSYENEIKNLKHALEDLKSILTIEKQQLQNKVKELQVKLKLGLQKQSHNRQRESLNRQRDSVNIQRESINVQRECIDKSDNMSAVNNSNLRSVSGVYNNQSGQSSQLRQQNNELLTQLQQKIDKLQSQLKYTRLQLLSSSQQLTRLQQLHQLTSVNNSNNQSNNTNNNQSNNNDNNNINTSNAAIINPQHYNGVSTNHNGLSGLTTNMYGNSQQSNSNISVYWEEEVDRLNSQVLTLRSTILTLKDQIEFKEQKTSELKHEIYKLKMKLASFQGNNNNSINGNANVQDSQINHQGQNKYKQLQEKKQQQQVQQQQLQQENLPKKSPIHIILNQHILNQPISNQQNYNKTVSNKHISNQPISNKTISNKPISNKLISDQSISNNLIAELQSQLNQLQLQNQQLLINQTHKNQTISLLQSQIHHLNNQHKKLSQQIIHLNNQLNHYKLAESSVNYQILEELQKLRNKQNLTDNQKCTLLAQDISKLESAIYQIRNDYQLQLSTLKNKIKTLQNDIHTKDLKISQLMRTLLQTRISINDPSPTINHQRNSINNHSHTNNHQNQHNKNQSQHNSRQFSQSSPDINYLLQQIQRQTQLISAKQIELTQTNTLLSKLQSEKSRANQNLALIVLLIVQIESLRNQLYQSQNLSKKQHSQTIQTNKMSRNTSRQHNSIHQQRQKVDFSLIKILQCSHQHLVNYEKMISEKRSNNINNNGESNSSINGDSRNSIDAGSKNSINAGSRNSINYGLAKTDQQIGDPLTQTVIKSSSKIIQESEDHPSEQDIIEGSSKRVIIDQNPVNQMKNLVQLSNYPHHISQITSRQFISLTSQSNNSSTNNIDSSYSISNPFRHYYRHAESTYNPMTFSPPSNKEQPSNKEHQVTNSTKKTVRINPNPINLESFGKISGINLGSFGKISESHNVQSSYGSVDNGSSSNYVPSHDQEKGYSYTLKNVNMIQSVGEGNSYSASKNSSLSKIEDDGNNNMKDYGNDNMMNYGNNNMTNYYSNYIISKPISYNMQKEGDKKFQYSFGKSKQIQSSSSIGGQIESRYIVEKRNPDSFSPSDSLISKESLISKGLSKGNSNNSSIIPLTTQIRPNVTTTIDLTSSNQTSYPYLNNYNQFSANSYNASQTNNYSGYPTNNYSGSQTNISSSKSSSSNSYLPTYNNTQKSSTFNQYNLATKGNPYMPSTNLYSTNFSANLTDTNATYQQYMSKPL